MAAEDTQGWLVLVPDPAFGQSYIPAYPQDRIRFTYLQPSFSETKSASYTATQVLGRSEPIRGYLGSGPRTIQLQLSVPIEGDDFPVMSGPGLPGGVSLPSPGVTSISQVSGGVFPNPLSPDGSVSIEQVFRRKLKVLDFIRSTVYPHYTQQTSNMLYPPPRVLILLGRWFSLLGIVTNWNMDHKAPWAAEGQMTPYFTDVSITVEECDVPYSFLNVFNGVLRLGGARHASVAGVLNLPT